jgi:hypothetical protein
VRVIGLDGEMVGVLTRDEAIALAEESGVDLVEIQPTADPPVCRIMDYGKYKFDLQKKANAAKKKQKIVEIKELKFRDQAAQPASLPRGRRQGQGQHPLQGPRDGPPGAGHGDGQAHRGRPGR